MIAMALIKKHFGQDFIFLCMTDRLPTKNLNKLNWIVSSTFSVLLFIFVLAVSRNFYFAFFRFLQSMVFTVVLAFVNVVILSRFVKQKSDKKITVGGLFYLISYSFAIVDFLAMKSLYSLLTGLKWEGDTGNVYEAYALAILATWIINTFFVVLQNLVILQYVRAQGEIENLQLKSNVGEMTNLLLRQQIQPHFLFNALSTIKSLYKENPDQGEEYLVHLANFLRVSVASHQITTTQVRNELNFCLDYLAMQKIRFGSAFSYTIELSENAINTKFLPYFSLQSLMENALKHNELSESDPVKIVVREEDGYLIVENTIHLPKHKEPSTGQGLFNLSERYRLLGEKTVAIQSDDSVFRVKMKMLDK